MRVRIPLLQEKPLHARDMEEVEEGGICRKGGASRPRTNTAARSADGCSVAVADGASDAARGGFLVPRKPEQFLHLDQ